MIYNLNLDDFFPRFKRFDLLYKLVKLFPKVRATLFIPVETRDHPGDNSILSRKHGDWCKEVRDLPPENFEFSFHGRFHTIKQGRNRKGKPEFEGAGFREANSIFRYCEGAFELAGIRYEKGFRPPRWSVSRGTIKALERRGYLYLADTPRNLKYIGNDEVGIPRLFFNEDIHKGVKQGDIQGFEKYVLPRDRYVVQRGYAYSRLDNNFDSNFQRICRRIRSLKNPEFKFLSEIAKEEKK